MQIQLRVDSDSVPLTAGTAKRFERDYYGTPEHIGRQIGSDIGKILQEVKETTYVPEVIIRGDLVRP
jgi:hypothetical protein